MLKNKSLLIVAIIASVAIIYDLFFVIYSLVKFIMYFASAAFFSQAFPVLAIIAIALNCIAAAITFLFLYKQTNA